MARDLVAALFFTLGSLAGLDALAQDRDGEPGEPLAELSEQHVESDGLSQRIDKVEAFLNGIDTLKSDFIQIAENGTITRGVLSLDRPGRLRFEYTDETPLLLVSDGTLLSFIDYDVGQVTRWPIDDTPLGILVQKKIDLRAADAMVNSLEIGGQSVILVSVDDPANNQQGNLTLLIEETSQPDGPPSLSLRGWEVMDGQGAVTRIRLEKTRLNLALADEELWSFKDPRTLPSQRRRRGR
ncbi:MULTISPECIES: outer membrane lipoprotein carrier protein LolA [unclassified Iodidimonas]|jgi:outer membrane lipoprotein-sorting protein|uniref:LolA family protein n=1 Tax=unclassified Iodidimonas TaxID=2626145 RepID=UPI00248212B3|nr:MULTISPECIES: outer membrane lipoprotein carrier protein LolA [unclassified Iodidimonas]